LDFSSAHANARANPILTVNVFLCDNQAQGPPGAWRAFFRLVLPAMALGVSCLARADGGVVRLREVQGPFVVTLFTAPEISLLTATEVSVMVQRKESGQCVLDASVDLGFCPPDGTVPNRNQPPCCRPKGFLLQEPTGAPGQTITVPATRMKSANKLVYSAPVVFPVGGLWRLRTSVRQEHAAASFDCQLPVSSDPPRLASLWPYLALVPAAIALFVMNQLLNERSKAQLCQEP
jgi:hypothetical protein